MGSLPQPHTHKGIAMWPRTRKRYAEYEAAVAAFYKAEGIECLTANTAGDSEGYVSSHGCDCCGDSQQQILHSAQGYNRDRDVIQPYEICEDCLYYAEYGRLDDTQMDEIDNDPTDHEHKWGPWEQSRLAGNWHRKCQVPGCKDISLDNDDE